MTADVVIAGAGLAGACAALALAPSCRLLVLDDGAPGASHAAAGLVNPFLGRKAKRAWRADEALRAVRHLSEEAGLPLSLKGLLRPARDEAQAAVFRERATEHPTRLDWLTHEEARERFPEVQAPLGALWVREGGHVEIPLLVEAVLREARRRGAEVVRGRLVGWRRRGAGLSLALDDRPQTTDHGSALPSSVVRGPWSIQTARLLVCAGDGTRRLVPGLPLHRVKGQTIRLRHEEALSIPPVSGSTYVVPVGPCEAVVGATFEHDFSTLDPTPEATRRLHEEAAGIVPALHEAEVTEARAGVRLTVPASVRPGRLPLLGPVEPGVWAFAGLGAKGLLTAPLLARHLAAWWDDEEAIWPEVSTRGLAKNG